MSKSLPWSDTENEALVALYFVMLDKAIAGQPYNKAAMIRTAQGNGTGITKELQEAPLLSRTRGSIEAKLMNCTAAHLDVSRDVTGEIDTMAGFGYVPLPNYQASLKDAVRNELDDRQSYADSGMAQA